MDNDNITDMPEQNPYDLRFELKHLGETLLLAEKQLEDAKNRNELRKEEIIAAKIEARENASHSFGNLYNSEDFEALAELSQYMNPVTDKIASFEEEQQRILQLEGVLKAPYFARIDFRFLEEPEYEKIYIGRTSLKKEDSYDMDIYDWRSPIASVFYRYVTGQVYYDAPAGRIEGEVNLKRQYEIHDGRLDYFFDADVQIIDEFLRKMLSQNTSSKMKTIVETIQKEQDEIIRDIKNDLMMVQGVAGSGKTSIALHRVAYLMYQGLAGRLMANNILILSPNTLFEQYISNVLPELGESNVVTATFEDMASAIMNNNQIQSRNEYLEQLIRGEEKKLLMKQALITKTSLAFVRLTDRLIEELPERWIPFADVIFHGKKVIGREKLIEKAKARPDVPMGVKLKQLEDYIIEMVKLSNNGRIRRSEEAELRQEIHKYTELSTLELYRTILNTPEYMEILSEEMLGSKEAVVRDQTGSSWIQQIIEFTTDRLVNRFVPFDDSISLTYLHLRLNGTMEYKNIRQVVIDEAQDYYPLQYEIFRILFSGSKITVLGDMNQTLEKQETIDFYQQVANIMNKRSWALATMDKSFRCTNEILRFSTRFIESAKDIKSFNRNGEEPQIYVAHTPVDYVDQICQEVEICSQRGYKSIGIICKTEKKARHLYSLLKERLDIQLIQNGCESNLQGVFLIPVYMSKGLEFDGVLVCDTDNNTYSSQDDRKLLYIACTRALHRLNLFCMGKKSPLL